MFDNVKIMDYLLQCIPRYTMPTLSFITYYISRLAEQDDSPEKFLILLCLSKTSI